MKLLEFLSSLATDTDLMSAFRKSPQAALNSAGLREEDQRALLAGDPVALRKAVLAERAVVADSPTSQLESGAQPEVFPEPPPPPPPPTRELEAKPEVWPEPPPPPPPSKPDPMPELTTVHPPPPHPPRPDPMPELTTVHPPPPPPPKHSSDANELQSAHTLSRRKLRRSTLSSIWRRMPYWLGLDPAELRTKSRAAYGVPRVSPSWERACAPACI